MKKVLYTIMFLLLISNVLSADCGNICEEKELPYSNCCIITPNVNSMNYEVYDKNLNLVDYGSTTLLSNYSNEQYIIFSQDIGYYKILLDDGSTTYIEVAKNNDNLTIIIITLVVLHVLMILCIILSFYFSAIFFLISAIFSAIIGIFLLNYDYPFLIGLGYFILGSILALLTFFLRK